MTWQPTFIEKQIGAAPSSTCPATVVTDAGGAVLKAINNPEGPHALAREWIVTRLARWFGLPTFDIAILDVTDIDDIAMGKHARPVDPGPAIVTRYERGKNWDGKDSTLALIENTETITGIIVFDTWVRNRDRYLHGTRINLGNVYLSEENAAQGRFVLKAIDHTHCLAQGDLNAKMSGIDAIRDGRIYGLFPEFRSRVENPLVSDALNRLGNVDRSIIMEAVDDLPKAWQVEPAAVAAMTELLVQRASYLQDHLNEQLMKAIQLPLEGLDQ